MKRNQKSSTNGIQNILFPMETLLITQGDNEGTHRGTFAIDNAGKNAGIDPWFAPVDMRVVSVDERNGNAVWFESINKVRFADGTIDYVTFMIIHDNYIKDIIALMKQGYVFKQGEEVGDEGVAGQATGNHCHIEVAKGRFHHQYDHIEKYNVYHLPNNMAIENACFMDGTVMKQGKAKWHYTKEIKTSTLKFKKKGRVKALYDAIRIRTTPNLRKNDTGYVYNTGMELSYFDVVEHEGWYWAKYYSKGNQIHYVALQDIKGKNVFWKQV